MTLSMPIGAPRWCPCGFVWYTAHHGAMACPACASALPGRVAPGVCSQGHSGQAGEPCAACAADRPARQALSSVAVPVWRDRTEGMELPRDGESPSEMVERWRRERAK